MFQKWQESIKVNGKEKHVEIRWDGFFERYCRIIDRVGLELTKIEDFSDKIKEDCIFCQPSKLATFDEKFGFKRMENEHAFLFPNINPYAKYSSVCAFREHYIPLNKFSPDIIKANLELAINYIKIVSDTKTKYASINWNYLMPAGASILHPHTQIVVDEIPTTYMRKILMHGKNAFLDYVEKNKEGRHIKDIGGVSLFTPFAPFGFNEVFGFTHEKFEEALGDIAKAISLVLSYYHSIGRNSFNLSIYHSIDDSIPLHFRMVTRQNMAKYYRNDAMFFERLHFETILEKKPEEIAKEIKNFMI